MTRWVAGFMFSPDRKLVALIHKKHGPALLIGKWNAIGGKVEEDRHADNCRVNTITECDQMNYNPCTCGGESPKAAMVREFEEETGVKTSLADWEFVTDLVVPRVGVVSFYRAFSEKVAQTRTITDEEVALELVENIEDGAPVVANLPWLVRMALSLDYDSAAGFTVTELQEAA